MNIKNIAQVALVFFFNMGGLEKVLQSANAHKSPLRRFQKGKSTILKAFGSSGSSGETFLAWYKGLGTIRYE